MRNRDGFTLIEITIAVVILVVILLLAIPSVNGVLADRRLRHTYDDVNRLVLQAQERSILERRNYLILWRDKKFVLRPEGYRQGEERAPTAILTWPKEDAFTLSFPNALEEDPPPAWVFWPSGNCESAIVTYRGRNGIWKAEYSALTARPELLNYAVR